LGGSYFVRVRKEEEKSAMNLTAAKKTFYWRRGLGGATATWRREQAGGFEGVA